ncbi:MAG: hypothetical protein PHN75_04275 [Syntrophales bacterium]|nr:hypothetical protein [Syntrophales bacterium]
MILSGMGQIHIEVAVEKMKRKFGVEVNLNVPKVPYKETIKGKTNIQGKYKKQSGGRGQFGDCWIDIEPLPRGSGFEFLDKIVGGVIPGQYRPAVEKGIVEAMEGGVLAGYPVVDVRVFLVDGSYHTVDSSEMAFKVAGSLGFKKGVLLCQPTLLEPIVNIFIEVPDEYMGDVIGDLNSHRGKVLGMDTKGAIQIIKGQVPLAEILKYAPDLRSMTSGRGTFTYEHSHYEEVPPLRSRKDHRRIQQKEGRRREIVIRAAVITVSDKGSRNEREDLSGPEILRYPSRPAPCHRKDTGRPIGLRHSLAGYPQTTICCFALQTSSKRRNGRFSSLHPRTDRE